MTNAAAIYPFGISGSGKALRACVYAPGAMMCRLVQYSGDAESPVSVTEMELSGEYPGIFSCMFEKKGSSYIFETDRGFVTDPYGRLFEPEKLTQDTEAHDGGAAGGMPLTHAGLKAVEETGSARRAIFAETGRLMKDDVRPQLEFCDMIMYKLHVRGFTADPSSRVSNPGTYAGVLQKLPYLKKLGINAVLLMPCYEFEDYSKGGFGELPRRNFWGYGAKGMYFAPKTAFAVDPARACNEFAALVKTLHRNGIEVLMEMNFCAGTPESLMLESMRFWAGTYHIDGFRLVGSSMPLRLIASDPYLGAVKLIADGWDRDCLEAAHDGRLPRFAVCSDNYMVACRRMLKGDEGQVRAFSEALGAGSELYANVNCLADHNGFTLNDVFCYDQKHNEANGENNSDGREINYSWNCGAEGPTTKKNINRLRTRMIKNALAVLYLSQGTPLLLAGDEFGATHMGNNNPYCCDNEQGHVIWERTKRARELTEYTAGLIALRSSHRVLKNRLVLKGSDYIYSGCPDISFHGTRAWYPDYGYFSRTLGMLLNGEYAMLDRERSDVSFYIAINMHWEPHEFDLPGFGRGTFRFLFSTDSDPDRGNGRNCTLGPRSISVFVLEKGEPV